VGWYLYTTFVASTTGQPRLNVVSAEITGASTNSPQLKLVLVNPGPVNVQISSIEIGGQVISQGIDPNVIAVGQQATVSVSVTGITATPGTMLPGRVILSGGQSFPFNAVVKP
jgi:P pilus assembly chaperone PapD